MKDLKLFLEKRTNDKGVSYYVCYTEIKGHKVYFKPYNYGVFNLLVSEDI